MADSGAELQSMLDVVEACVKVADSGAELQSMLDVVEAYVSRWKMKINNRKSQVMMVVGKMAPRVIWMIGEEIVDEAEELKCECVLIGSYEVMFSLGRWRKRQKS